MSAKKDTPAGAVLVFADGRSGEPFTTSDIIAEHTGHSYRSIQRTIENQMERLERFGQVRFEITPVRYWRGTNMKKVYHLGEEQATLLITFLRNTEVVADFKVELVRQFFVMRQRLLERQSEQWRQARAEGKAARRVESRAIQDFVYYARAHGSRNAERYYRHFTELACRAAGVEPGGRDALGEAALCDLRVAEMVIDRGIREEIAAGSEYHQAFQRVKDKVLLVAALAFAPAALGAGHTGT